MKNFGISLIVLIITIVVIIILTGAIVLNISQNNPIDKASEALFKSNMKSMQDEVSMYMSSNIQADGTPKYPTKSEIKSADSYNVNNLDIVDGKIVYKNPSDRERVWAESIGVRLDYTNGLVANWKMDGDAVDSTNNTTSTVTGASLTTDRYDKSNKAYSFNGTSDYISINKTWDQILGGVGSDITVLSWVKLGSPVATHGTIIGTYADSVSLGLWIRETNTITTRIHGSDYISNCNDSNTTMDYNNSKWNLFAITIDRHGYLKQYNNGIYDKMLDIHNNTGTFGTSTISIGKATGSAYYYYGALDDIRVYNRVLSTEEIKAIYDLQKVS